MGNWDARSSWAVPFPPPTASRAREKNSLLSCCRPARRFPRRALVAEGREQTQRRSRFQREWKIPGPSFPRHRAVYKSPSPGISPHPPRETLIAALRPFSPSPSRTLPTGLFASSARMSEKCAEAPAELSAKEVKEKKAKPEDKTVLKEKKKEIVEDDENGAEEVEEDSPDDVDDEGGDEEEGDENGQEQDGHAEKRSAEKEEDEVDPKRQKTENGSSA
ncbi:parathymosin [Indicator indicator]|uniref:parathymosin n=1 Tax=Indicator indicator TaxID=1002788 RepID=UPI0023DF72CC|nr:parathymosin [Indicator indicator]